MLTLTTTVLAIAASTALAGVGTVIIGVGTTDRILMACLTPIIAYKMTLVTYKTFEQPLPPIIVAIS